MKVVPPSCKASAAQWQLVKELWVEGLVITDQRVAARDHTQVPAHKTRRNTNTHKYLSHIHTQFLEDFTFKIHLSPQFDFLSVVWLYCSRWAIFLSARWYHFIAGDNPSQQEMYYVKTDLLLSVKPFVDSGYEWCRNDLKGSYLQNMVTFCKLH